MPQNEQNNTDFSADFKNHSCMYSCIPSNERLCAHLIRDSIPDRIAVMRTQEEATYICTDYLYRIGLDENNDNIASKGSRKEFSIDRTCRERICQWYFNLIDHYKISHEIVPVSLSYLDRFMSSYGCKDSTAYKLVAASSLRLAVKVHESNRLFMLDQMLPALTKFEFTMRQISDMELIILRGIGWMVNPPTVHLYVRHFLAVISDKTSSPDLERVLDNAMFYSDCSCFDYSCVTQKPSTIAIAAILNAIEFLSLEELMKDFLVVVAELLPDVHLDCLGMRALQLQLRRNLMSSPASVCTSDI